MVGNVQRAASVKYSPALLPVQRRSNGETNLAGWQPVMLSAGNRQGTGYKARLGQRR